MPLPCDPSPYRTIASALRHARDNRPMPTPAEQRAKRIRDRRTLARHIASQRASIEACHQRDQRIADAVANRFHDTHGDYATSRPFVPDNFNTTR